MSSRLTYLVANWKLHMTGESAAEFIHSLHGALPPSPKAKVWIAPPYTAIPAAATAAEGTPFSIGGQNASQYEEGAYTGEVSAAMLAKEKAHFVLIGHSERRALFGESDEVISLKMVRAVEAGLVPILCIGERESAREGGETQAVLEGQLSSGFKLLAKEQLKKVIIAYEPVWAIGTGKAATPKIADDTHSLCRAFIEKKWGEEVAKNTPLLYGGSVNPKNIVELLSCEAIDGALIGGASLSVAALGAMIQLTEETL